MTRLAIVALVLIVLLGVAIRTQAPELTDVHGAVVVVNERNGWYGIVPDNDRGTRYAPDRLPDEFKMDGVRVVFSGRVGTVDPNARAWGIPITLSSIRLEPTP